MADHDPAGIAAKVLTVSDGVVHGTREDRSGLRHFRWLYWWTDLSSADWAIPFPASAFLEIDGATVDLSHGDVILHSLVPPAGADRREPSATLEREGGYGLSLILMLADETRYERTDGGTTVRLRWTRELRG